MKIINDIFCFRYCKNCKKRMIPVPIFGLERTLCCKKCLSGFKVVGFYSRLLGATTLAVTCFLFGLEEHFPATLLTLLMIFNITTNDYIGSLVLPLKKL